MRRYDFNTRSKIGQCLTIGDVLKQVKVLRRVRVSKRASLVGQIISMSIVFGHVTQILTRSLSIDVVKALSWDSFIPVSQESLQQMEFWQKNEDIMNSKYIFDPYKCTIVIYSDASNTVYAGYEVECDGMCTAEEAVKS